MLVSLVHVLSVFYISEKTPEARVWPHTNA